jgi:hypothetical protein
MKPVGPPKLAAWLLQHHVRGYHADSLAGDLTEEYAAGRDDGWYWGQVLGAVSRSYYEALRMYGLRLLAAVAAGWCAVIVGIVVLGRLWLIVQHELGVQSGDSQALQNTYAFHGIAWTLLAGCLDVFAGRLVVRICRTPPRLVAAIFALSILAYRVPLLYGRALGAGDGPRQIALAQDVAATLLWMGCVWFGGLWQRRVDTNSTKR